MENVNKVSLLALFHRDLKIAKKEVYDKCDFVFENPKLNSESEEYGACTFKLNQKIIQHRVSKITPTKVGQFVTIWKRDKKGITEPFDINDDIDFIIITSRDGKNFGQFIFPKVVLAEKGIITQNGKIGKRGIRVYPPWDKVTNKQARLTQSWQTKFFISIKDDSSTEVNLVKAILI
jgi:hypothetical protein